LFCWLRIIDFSSHFKALPGNQKKFLASFFPFLAFPAFLACLAN